MSRLFRFIIDLIVFMAGIMNIYKDFYNHRFQFYTGIIMLFPLIVFIIDEITLNNMASKFWDDEERRDRD